MVQTAARIHSGTETGRRQQPGRRVGQLGLTGCGVLQVVQRRGKAAKVVHRLGLLGGHDLHIPGLPVRRHHQHRFDI